MFDCYYSNIDSQSNVVIQQRFEDTEWIKNELAQDLKAWTVIESPTWITLERSTLTATNGKVISRWPRRGDYVTLSFFCF